MASRSRAERTLTLPLAHTDGAVERTEIVEDRTKYRGLLFIGDPHVAAHAPGSRCDDYASAILDKLGHCLEAARRERLAPIILGDLFHRPRDNANSLLVSLIQLLAPHRPYCLVGNHDKFQARFTDAESLAVLSAAGVVRLLEQFGPAVVLSNVAGQRVLLGASPDRARLPSADDVPPLEQAFTVWVTHHEETNPHAPAAPRTRTAIDGIDLVVNGHQHVPAPDEIHGDTLWCAPGAIARVRRSPDARDREPIYCVWRPERPQEVERVPIPHAPFDQVFLKPELADAAHDGLDDDDDDDADGSRFIRGLEFLSQRRTREGGGLADFLTTNLTPREAPSDVDAVIWELFGRVQHDGRQEP